MASSSPSERVSVRRKPSRASYQRETINAILDEALTCSLGFVIDGQPYVTPIVHARVDECLLFHGSATNRTLNALAGGALCCATVTLIDGIVLGRTARKHSMNYRSVVILGAGTEITSPAGKREALMAIIERMVPGRSVDLESPQDADLKATCVIALPISEASAKIRTGGPTDPPGDASSNAWTGQLPLATTPGAPIPAPESAGRLMVPDYLHEWRR
jgi:nitroimidazol reductase NimA-like FMN-containing flavoprotein (pyridoxamine 5'-phosphate oxidase superfamily)